MEALAARYPPRGWGRLGRGAKCLGCLWRRQIGIRVVGIAGKVATTTVAAPAGVTGTRTSLRRMGSKKCMNVRQIRIAEDPGAGLVWITPGIVSTGPGELGDLSAASRTA